MRSFLTRLPLREKNVLSPEEFRALLKQLSVRDRAMVLLIGSKGMRRSELMALVWTDINVQTMEVSITRSCVRNRFGNTKAECSRRPVPLHPLILEALQDWRRESIYRGDGDFLFPSIRLDGKKPLSPGSLLKKSIRPALERAEIKGKIIGWHNFRHTLGTLTRLVRISKCRKIYFVMPIIAPRSIFIRTPFRKGSETQTPGWWSYCCSPL